MPRSRTSTLQAARPVRDRSRTEQSRTGQSRTAQSRAVRSEPYRSEASRPRAGRQARAGQKGANIVLPAAGVASLVVAAVTVAAYLISPHGSGATSLAQAIDSLPQTDSIVLLEQERQEIITMNAAIGTMSTASKPAVVLPAQAMSGGSGSQSAVSTQTVTAPDPAQAQQIAQQLMPNYGFSVAGEWSCLDELWTRESSWTYDAVNAQSGAYGIAQALPPGRMDSIASDWQTNAVTQIKWGLSYISSRYGTPCAAWDHEINIGWY